MKPRADDNVVYPYKATTILKMKIPAIFHYKTKDDRTAIMNLKKFLKDSVKVYELASVDKHEPIPNWRFILIELIDGKYLLRLVDASPDKTNYIETYEHDAICEGLENEDKEDVEMIEGEIREIIIAMADNYFPD